MGDKQHIQQLLEFNSELKDQIRFHHRLASQANALANVAIDALGKIDVHCRCIPDPEKPCPLCAELGRKAAVIAHETLEHLWEARPTTWQPIETAPKDGTRVLAWSHGWSAPHTVQHYGDAWGGWGFNYEIGPFAEQPSHWMPLPGPPEK